MDSKKICFIICVNDQLSVEEALNYINRISVPEGYSIECLTVEDAVSMTSGYNEAMLSSDAKYKIYLHQDVLIINTNFIRDILNIFEDETIGMVGMVGSPKMPDDGIMWHGLRYGMVLSWNHRKTELSDFEVVRGPYKEVEAVDGLLMATQYDIRWRDDIFDKWDFYDISESFEMRKAGYKVVVPYMDIPWCLHDDGVSNMVNYDMERKKFIGEYMNEE